MCYGFSLLNRFDEPPSLSPVLTLLLAGANGLNHFIEWYTDNPAFAGTDPLNSCTTSGGQVYYCTTVNLYDTVNWYVPSSVRPPPLLPSLFFNC